MDSKRNFLQKWVDDYSLMLLNWAYKRLGDREQAQELVQEVWLQVFRAVKSNEAKRRVVQKPENFIWKIAHFVWCHYLRENQNYKMCVPIDDVELADESNFLQEICDNEEAANRLAYMRKKIVNLDFLQREIMVSYYIDGRSQKEIAGKLGISEATVKWHLFDTRKKLKEEIVSMKENDFVYRPHKLDMAINGQIAPAPDTMVIKGSLTKQNICIACYKKAKTLDELAEILGIPKVYLESDLEWLVEKEFMIKEKNRYSTAFVITTAQDEQDRYAVYVKHKEALSDVIVNGLLALEEQIRSIGFYGSDRPFDKLLWLLIYRFCNYLKIPYLTEEATVRPDGGKYFPLGFDRTDFAEIEKAVDTSGWAYNGSMCNDNFWWFGLYNFGQSEIVELIDQFVPEWRQLHEVLCILIHSDFDTSAFDENQRFALSKLVQKGFVKMDGSKAYPTFCVFTSAQYKQLEETVYEPIARKLQEEIDSLEAELAELCKKRIPTQLAQYYNFFVRMELGDIGYLTTIFAFNEGKLYVPADSHDGEFLTFMYIKPELL